MKSSNMCRAEQARDLLERLQLLTVYTSQAAIHLNQRIDKADEASDGAFLQSVDSINKGLEQGYSAKRGRAEANLTEEARAILVQFQANTIEIVQELFAIPDEQLWHSFDATDLECLDCEYRHVTPEHYPNAKNRFDVGQKYTPAIIKCIAESCTDCKRIKK